MSELRQPESGHPSAADLLLFLEEGGPRIDEHLAACPPCRERLAELRCGDANLGEWRGLRQSGGPEPPPFAALEARLGPVSKPAAPPLLRLLRSPRTWVPLGVAAGLLLVFQYHRLSAPAPVEAATLLRHACERVQQERAGHAPRRRVEVRRNGRVMTQPAPELAARLAAAQFDWSDPLNPDDFARWRDRQARKRDSIERGEGWVRLATAVFGAGGVESATLTVSSADWHPLARTVRFDASDEVVASEVETPAASTPGAAPAPASVSGGVAPQAEPAPMAAHLAAAADTHEIELWEVLHRSQADVIDSAQPKRQNGQVCYELWAEPGRREAVVGALAEVGARECRPEGAAANRPVRVLPPLVANRTAASPLHAALVRHFGTEELADRYLGRVVDEHLRLLARVTALERFLRWFTPERMARLDVPLRARVAALAREYTAAVESGGDTYLGLVAEGLRVAAPAAAPEAADRVPASSAPCAAEPAATALSDDLRRLQLDFDRIFTHDAEAAGARPVEETVRLRADLARRLRALCVPGN